MTTKQTVLLWAGILVLWTGMLLFPFSRETHAVLEDLTWGRKYLAAKTLHVLGYALLTGLTGRLPVSPRRRWLLMYFLLVHAVGTELGQKYFSGRGGDLEDVGYDAVGIFFGWIVSWKFWTREGP